MSPVTPRLIFTTLCAIVCCSIVVIAGCGTSIRRSGTEQLLTSDAIDRTVAQIDFSVLAGRDVFLDPQYINTMRDPTFVSGPYIISSLRQQMSAAGCRLQDAADKADYIVEARVGALGTDLHDVTYGLPASNALNAAASVISSVPAVPTIPEISVANRNDQSAAAKIALFAYHRESRLPVWQSGIATAKSTAKDTWVLGAGPVQRGTIYEGTLFAGNRLRVPFANKNKGDENGLPSKYAQSKQFTNLDEFETQLAEAKAASEEAARVQQASHEKPAPPAPKPEPAPTNPPELKPTAAAEPEKPTATSSPQSYPQSDSPETSPHPPLRLPWSAPAPEQTQPEPTAAETQGPA